MLRGDVLRLGGSRMKPLYVALLIALSTPSLAFAQTGSETVFVGQLRSMTLTPRDREAERRAREAGGDLIISNSCGTASATFRVIRSTRRLPREVRTHDTVGEWCDPPLPLNQGPWLIVMESRTRELQAVYEIVEQQGASYALVLDSQEELSTRSPEIRPLLDLQPLPEPLEYDVSNSVSSDGLAEWVSRRPALELRDGAVWIARGLPLANLFPGPTPN